MSNTPFNSKGMRLIATVPNKEKVISMATFQGTIFLATGTRVYRLAERRKGQFKLVPIQFEEAA